MNLLRETGINGQEPFWMVGNVAGQKTQELSEYRIVFLYNFHARKYDLAAGTDRVVNLVTLDQLQGTADCFRHRSLVAVGQCGMTTGSNDARDAAVIPEMLRRNAFQR